MRRRKILEMIVSAGVGAAALAGTANAQSSPATSAIDASLRAAVERKDVPGVVALVTDREHVLYQGAFGVADVSTGRPLAQDSMFRIASMTKPVTSVALMQLVEQGKIGLDDPAEKYLPELKDVKVIESFDAKTGDYKLRPAARPRPSRNSSPTLRASPIPSPARSGVISSRKPATPSPSADRCCSIPAHAGTIAPASTWSAGWSRSYPDRSWRTISASTSSCRSR
jgi:hypothetical protein